MGGCFVMAAVLARALPGDVADPTAAQEAKLAAAIRAFDELNDERARTLLGDLLSSAPPDRLAAQAYLYLGIIDFNALDKMHANEELQRALELDPAVEMPHDASPKLSLAFEELRRLLARRLRAEDDVAPAGAVSPPPQVKKRAARPRVWPWVLGAAALVAASASVWGWVQVASFEQLKGATTPITQAQAQSAQSAAQVGEPVGIAAAIAAAGLVTGAVLTW
ncbi:MAG TPA: hypothetical protein VMB50_20540 [Myxococcales bacterium]|nr:hypothetical protein [Myxococcales bacterium]